MDTERADTAVDIWEDQLAKLGMDYGEALSNKVKMAVFYGMLPKDLQERVLDKCAVNWEVEGDEGGNILAWVKAEVKNMSKFRRDMATPKPMEVDQVALDGVFGEPPKVVQGSIWVDPDMCSSSGRARTRERGSLLYTCGRRSAMVLRSVHTQKVGGKTHTH